jgi:siroheme synthase (precorrin-2 oxidase/ferrochelatase)
MATVKLVGALPSGQNNGLPSLVDELVDNPTRMHVALVILDCKATTTETDTGEVVPTARIRRIEPIRREDRKAARRLMDRAMEERTGRTMLPIDLEDETASAFEDFDGGER